MKVAIVSATFLALSSMVSAQTMHIVSVGKNGLLEFCPDQITANPGDLVQFQFYPKNHSVIQGFFAQGCTPISQAPPGTAQVGSFSGFMPVSNTSTSDTIPTFTITVNGTSPEWFYCGQAKHCQSGMVFAINPTAAKSLEGFKANCANATENIVPGPPGSAAPPPAPAPPPAAASSEAPPVVAPTGVSIPSTTSGPAGSTSLPINSLASSTISRTAGWVVVGLAGCLSVAMLL